MENKEFSFKKVHGVVPTELYNKLIDNRKFDDTWDAWLSLAISNQLKKENYSDL